MKFVNSPLGRQLCLRGINAKVVQPGMIRVGATVQKLPPDCSCARLTPADGTRAHRLA